MNGWFGAVAHASVGADVLQSSQRGVQRKPVTVAAKSADHPDRDIGQAGMVAERLAGEHVGQMHLDKRDPHRGERVAQSDAGMSECTGIAQDDRGAVVTGMMDAPDQFVLGIGLEPDKLMPGRMGPLGQLLVDVGQGLVTVEIRFTGTEQVEIGSVQDQNFSHAGTRLASGDPGTRQSVRAVAILVQFAVDRRCLAEKFAVYRA